MSESLQLTAVVERDADTYVALCPEFDIATQGPSVDEARTNLEEAVELFFESWSMPSAPTSPSTSHGTMFMWVNYCE